MKEKKQQQEDDNQFNMNLLYAPELEKGHLYTTRHQIVGHNKK